MSPSPRAIFTGRAAGRRTCRIIREKYQYAAGCDAENAPMIRRRNMNVDDVDRKRKYSLLMVFYILCLLIHTVLLLLFHYLEYYDLMILIVVNMMAFLLNIYLLRINQFLLSMQLGILAIAAGSFIDAIFLGWRSYFGQYLIASAITIINSLSMKLKWKILEVALPSVLFVALLIVTHGGYSVYAVRGPILEWIGLFTILAFIFAILWMQFQNFWENEMLKKRLEEISDIDILTGAYNRRFTTSIWILKSNGLPARSNTAMRGKSISESP
jgi:hypothetical protein